MHLSGSRVSGLTLLEILIVLALIGILAAVGVRTFRAPESRLLANDVKLTVQQARYEAIRRNHPVAVLWNPGTQSITSVIDEADPSVAAACGGTTTLKLQDASEYPSATIASEPAVATGVVWLPSGQIRSCVGGIASEVRLTISDSRTSRTVTVTPAGRVDIQ